MMEWSNELCMEFLDLYEAEPIIWDTKYSKDHKDRNLVHDAWKRIEMKMSVRFPLPELKKKKENLMATYRKLAIKVKKSQLNGFGPDDIYKPEWFLYDRMDSFLGSIYTPRKKHGFDRHDMELDNDEDIVDNDDEINLMNLIESSVGNSSFQEQPQVIARTTTIPTTLPTVKPNVVSETRSECRPPVEKKRKVENMSLIEKRLDQAYNYLKQVASNPSTMKDEVDLFCELLSLKLRGLDEERREEAMHEISTVMFNMKKRSKKQTKVQPVQQRQHNASLSPHRSPQYESYDNSTSISYVSPPNSIQTEYVMDQERFTTQDASYVKNEVPISGNTAEEFPDGNPVIAVLIKQEQNHNGNLDIR